MLWVQDPVVTGTGRSFIWQALRVSPAAGAMLHAAAPAARGPACVTEQGAGGSCEGIAGNCSHRSRTRVWQKSQSGQLKQAHTDTPEKVPSSAAYRSTQREGGYTLTPLAPQNNRQFFFPQNRKALKHSWVLFLFFFVSWGCFFSVMACQNRTVYLQHLPNYSTQQPV